jgi:hypothetical protein
MLTPHQISHVQGSFAQVAPIADAAAEMFYRRLFELDPTLSRLFKHEMKQRGKKLIVDAAEGPGPHLHARCASRLACCLRRAGTHHEGRRRASRTPGCRPLT